MRRWVARWRVALRIARRDAGRHRLRTVLVVAMVALPLLAGTAMISLVRSQTPTPQSEAERVLGPSAQAQVRPAGCRPYAQAPDPRMGGACDADDQLDVRPLDANAIREVLEVEDVASYVTVATTFVSDGAAVSDHGVTEAEATTLGRIVRADLGRLPSGPGELAVTPGLARRLSVEIGDRVTLQSGTDDVEVRVVGLIEQRTVHTAVALGGTLPSTSPVPDPVWLVLGDAPVLWEQVKAGNEQGWEVQSRAVALDPPRLEGTPFHQQVSFAADGTDALRSAGLLGVVLAMGLVEIVLLIGPAFAVGAKRSRRQLAVVAAAGGAPSDLRRAVLSGGLVVGAAASVIGIGLGLALITIGTRVANATMTEGYLPLVLPTWELPAMALVAVVLGLAAAWMPARAAARGDVVAALAGRRADPHPVRGLGWLGLATAALGVMSMVLGAIVVRPEVLVAGVLLLEVGVVVMSGSIVVGVGRLAPRLGVASRFALRDAGRHRSRTAPAVAAVLAAVAAATAGGIYLDGQSAADRASWVRVSDAPGLILFWNGEVTEGADSVGAALAVVSSEIETSSTTPVSAAVSSDELAEADGATDQFELLDVWVASEPDPDLRCPDPDETPDDARCITAPSMGTSYGWTGAIVDDGTLMTAAALPGAENAAAVLASGGVVVEPPSVWPDGAARVAVQGPSGQRESEQIHVRAAAAPPVPTYSTVLSPEAAERLGLTSVTVGGLITTADELSQADVDRLNAAVRQISPSLSLSADRPRPEGVPISLVLVAAATLVALIAVGLAVGLAGADTRPDMATLAAVGAPPRVRRRIAAAQAGVIAGIGGVLGTLTGIPIGLVLSLWGRESSGYGDLWPLAVPWQTALLAVVVPVVAMAAAWLLTRSRLPLVRRVEG